MTRTPMVYNAGDKPTVHRMLWVLVWRFIVARSVRIAAISRFIAMELEKSGVRRGRIQVIYSRPPKRRGSERGPELPFDSSTLKIAFVGQVIPGKGLDLLIDAFRDIAPSFPAARILIAGRVSDWTGDKWARDLRDRTGRDPVLASKIAFLGFVENIPALLQSVEILVAPSLLEEALGLVVMEAKAAGRPAIVFPSGGLSEMIEPDVDGIVCRDKSVEALADALRRYLEDPLLARRHGAAALQSLDRLGVSDFAERWSKLYESTR
jgi:glycosyltransferase involved in cell wall biosynthesis